jgi:hypothetical protein
MAVFGYFLSCEEHSPAELVEQARMAEQAGPHSLWISDYDHPWHDGQGQSPFVGPTAAETRAVPQLGCFPSVDDYHILVSQRFVAPCRQQPPCLALQSGLPRQSALDRTSLTDAAQLNS